MIQFSLHWQIGHVLRYPNINPHILEVQNVMRKDEVKESYAREDIIRSAPAKEAGCIIVPNVVE